MIRNKYEGIPYAPCNAEMMFVRAAYRAGITPAIKHTTVVNPSAAPM